jgi:hypothetical protein
MSGSLAGSVCLFIDSRRADCRVSEFVLARLAHDVESHPPDDSFPRESSTSTLSAVRLACSGSSSAAIGESPPESRINRLAYFVTGERLDGYGARVATILKDRMVPREGDVAPAAARTLEPAIFNLSWP